MKIDIISVVPDLLQSPFAHSIMKRAKDKGLLEVNCINLRDHTTYARAQVDDYQFGLKAGGLSKMIPPPVGGALGFGGVPTYTNLFWVFSILTITMVVAFRLKRSSLGRAMISVREDEIAAQAMGVNIARQKVLAFVMAAFFAGVAGGLFAHERSVIIMPKDAGFQRSFDYVIMTVLGGRGSITGVMLAAGLLTALPEFLREFEQYRLIVYALLLIIMMLVRPQGLLGIHEIWDLWPRRRSRSQPTSPVVGSSTPSQEAEL